MTGHRASAASRAATTDVEMLRTFKSPWQRRNAIRRYLAVAAVVVLLPTFAMIGWIVILSARAERAQLEANASKKAIEIASAVDRQATNLMNITAALAQSRFLAAADLNEFHSQASDLGRQLGLQIVLRDADADRQLVNTAMPAGSVLQAGPSHVGRAVEDAALRGNKPVLSNLFWAPLAKRHVVAAVAPVPSGDGRRRLLMVALHDGRLLAPIERANLEADYLVTILDAQRTIIARSDKHADFVGRRIARSQEDTVADERGVRIATAPNLEGVPFRWTTARTKVAGWTVSVGVPLSVLDAPLATARDRLIAAGALLALCASAFIHAFGTYLSRRSGQLGVDRPPNREEFRTLFESAPYGVIVTDMSGRIVLLNEHIAVRFGYDRDELVGGPIDRLIDDLADLAAVLDLEQQPERPRGKSPEMLGRRKSGGLFPIEVSLNPIRTSAGSFVVTTVIDITVRKQTAELLDLARRERERLHVRLIEAGEEERRRIARELHDETGQCLTAVTLSLKGLEAGIASADRPRLARAQDLLAELGQSLHRIAYQLRPTSLDDLGLHDAIANHVSEWSSQSGIAVDLHSRRPIETNSPQCDIALYRIVQEALTNVIKHARGATRVGIVLDRIGDEVRLTIEDNGCGFDVATMESSQSGGHGMGISGMRERLVLIGGRLEIEAAVGAGTTVYARMPVATARELA
jgi:PAS domain S-box-containing protein